MTIPSLEALPAMFAELARRFDDYLQSQEQKENPDHTLKMPMGTVECAEFLTEIEGRTITADIVYSRIYRRRLPYHKNGATLFFLRDEILKAMTAPRKAAIQFHEVVKSY